MNEKQAIMFSKVQRFSPCYKCPNRKLGCHDQCEKYLKYRKGEKV